MEEAWEVKEVREKELLLFSIEETENQAKYRYSKILLCFSIEETENQAKYR